MTSPGTNDDAAKRNDFVAGAWTVAPSRNLLLRGDEQVRLEPRVMDLLVYLTECAGRVVPKEELVERVWRARYVGDDVLSVTIYALRKALGDDARRPRYIETVPRRGYRWIAHLESAGPERAPVETITSASASPPPARRVPRMAAAALIVIALGAAATTWGLTGARRSRHVPSAESHEAYLKGRYFLDQRSIRGWRQALEQFQRAAALDSMHPAAQAGLADTYSAMSDFGVASPEQMRPRAMKAARRALELDPQSAEGLAALGRAQFLFDWDFAAAEANLARSVTLDPDYMPAYQSLAWLQSARGQSAEAIAAAKEALQLDPLTTARYTELAWVLALSGKHDEALHQLDRALQLNPRSSEAYMGRGWVHELAGRPDSAFAAYRDGARLAGAPDDSLQRTDAVYRAEGLAGVYRRLLNRRGDAIPMSNTWRAQLYARVGELDRAVESLEDAYRTREGALAWVNVEPSFQPLRLDARFQQIAARVAAGGAAPSEPHRIFR